MSRVEGLFLEHSRQILEIADVLEGLTLGCKDLSERLEVLEKKIEDMEKGE